MKVLMFGWEFPPHISGGLGTACYGLTKGLLQNDVDVLFVVPKTFGDEDAGRFRLMGAEDIPVRDAAGYARMLSDKFTAFGVNSLIVPYLNANDFSSYTAEKNNLQAHRQDVFSPAKYEFTGQYGKDLLTEVWRYASVAGEIAATNSFDVIHAHDWLSFPAGILARQLSGKPLIVHVHATEFDRSGEQVNTAVFEIEQKGMQLADKVIAVSEYTRQIIINRYNICPDKVVVIHNAIDDLPEVSKEVFPKKVEEKIVSYLGRVTYQKGPDYFVEAAAKVLKEHKHFRFVMAGSGDMLHKMIKKVAALRISSHFHFTGFLKGEEVTRMLQMSDVYVMPSVSEPFGISPLEAVRSNVPVIISRQSGVSEVLKNAVTLDFWDTDAMSNAIYALTQYKGLSNMFVRNSKREMKKLRWELQAKKIKEVYHLA